MSMFSILVMLALVARASIFVERATIASLIASRSLFVSDATDSDPDDTDPVGSKAGTSFVFLFFFLLCAFRPVERQNPKILHASAS